MKKLKILFLLSALSLSSISFAGKCSNSLLCSLMLFSKGVLGVAKIVPVPDGSEFKCDFYEHYEIDESGCTFILPTALEDFHNQTLFKNSYYLSPEERKRCDENNVLKMNLPDTVDVKTEVSYEFSFSNCPCRNNYKVTKLTVDTGNMKLSTDLSRELL